MGVSENAKFSEHLGGKDGLDSVFELVQAETKMLEQMELYIVKRAAIDMEYAERLAKLHEKVKVETTEYTDGSLLEKAWRMYMNESENKAITIMDMARTLNSTTLTRIKTLITKKRESALNFDRNRQKLDKDFSSSQEDMKRLEDIYKTALRECVKVKEKLDESYTKPKGQKEWTKHKEKFDHCSRKLHMNHNEYLLAISTLNKHKEHKEKIITPHLLDSMQDIEERYITPWKEVFEDIVANSSWSHEKLITSEKELKQSISMITGAREFVSFLTRYKKNPAPDIPYFFDDVLIKDGNSTSGLTKDALAINDLTHEQLQTKKQSLQQDKSIEEKNLELKRQEIEKQDKVLEEMSRDNKTVFSTIEQCHQCMNLRLEVQELQCKSDMLEVKHELVNDALHKTENPARPYIELNPPSRPNGSSTETLVHSATMRPLPDMPSESVPKDKRKSVTLPRFIKHNRRRESSTLPKPPSVNHVHNNDAINDIDDDDDDDHYDDPENHVTLEESSWYHGNIDRQTVSYLLKVNGDFIVREKSDGSGSKVLSVLWNGHTKHIIVQSDQDGVYKLESNGFSTIPELINHHHEKRLVIQASSGVVLINPVKRFFYKGDGFVTTRSDIKLEQRLGSGHFGEVWRGVLLTNKLSVAVKTCKTTSGDLANQRQKFLEEAEIMKDCIHDNVVKLIGVCIEGDPYYIILELCEKGDLLDVLRKEYVRLTLKHYMQMALDIANGMAYLEQKQIIHRDLAARNCLVNCDYKVKICDFGMSREEDEEGIYSIQQTKEIPFKWCAPEVWLRNTYSSKTDVWSYGVVLWEIYSQGQQPYTGMSNKDAKTQVDGGYRLHSPNGTPPDIYEVMKNCWDADPVKRFTFPQICQRLEKIKKNLRL